MTASQLMPGDRIFDSKRKQMFEVERVSGQFIYSRLLGWCCHDKNKLHPNISEVHRDGVQIWPELAS